VKEKITELNIANQLLDWIVLGECGWVHDL